MKLSYYKKILYRYRELKKRDCIEELVAEFADVSEETLENIVLQECQRKTKAKFHVIRSNIEQYYYWYLEQTVKNPKECGLLLKLADEIDFSPALMAKMIFEHHMTSNGKECSKDEISEMLNNTSLIEDLHLGAEISMCNLHDKVYGRISDMWRSCIGDEFEFRLKDELAKLGISYTDEKELREKGYDKTPDIKLDVPIAVEGHVINWIESKASFGDEERHKEYLRNQYCSYCNRFGPGLVIYWAGYVDELNTKDQGILLSDSFPMQIDYMNPSILTKRNYAL